MAASAAAAGEVDQVFDREQLAAMDREVEAAIAEGTILGGVLWVERKGAVYEQAYGLRAVDPDEPMTADTIFDVASITKVVVAAPAAMLCVERGIMGLDDLICKHLPDFRGGGREKITVRHLLLHTSGMPVNLSLSKTPFDTREQAIAWACREPLLFEPGTAYSYSSVGTMVLGAAIEEATGRRLDEFCNAEIFRPLGMNDSMFRPSGEILRRVAPGRLERGQVDDNTARLMGGVAAMSSLFTTTADLARFGQMLLNQGELDGVRVLTPESVRTMTTVQTPPDLVSHGAVQLPVRRGLGWDIDTPYRTPPHHYSRQRGDVFPLGSFGHAGWTGQMLWIDPFSRTTVVFLCNRYRPGKPSTSPQAVYALHHRLSTLAARAVRDFDFNSVPGALPRQTDDGAR